MPALICIAAMPIFLEAEFAGKSSIEVWLAYLACSLVTKKGGNFFRLFLIFISYLSYCHIPSISVSSPFTFRSFTLYVQFSVVKMKRLVHNYSVLVGLLFYDYRKLSPLA
jgi:hypothetical protein